MKIRIAVVDDERIVGSRLKNALEKTEEGSRDCVYEVEAFTAVEPFFQQMASKGFHLVFHGSENAGRRRHDGAGTD